MAGVGKPGVDRRKMLYTLNTVVDLTDIGRCSAYGSHDLPSATSIVKSLGVPTISGIDRPSAHRSSDSFLRAAPCRSVACSMALLPHMFTYKVFPFPFPFSLPEETPTSRIFSPSPPYVSVQIQKPGSGRKDRPVLFSCSLLSSPTVGPPDFVVALVSSCPCRNCSDTN